MLPIWKPGDSSNVLLFVGRGPGAVHADLQGSNCLQGIVSTNPKMILQLSSWKALMWLSWKAI